MISQLCWILYRNRKVLKDEFYEVESGSGFFLRVGTWSGFFLDGRILIRFFFSQGLNPDQVFFKGLDPSKPLSGTETLKLPFLLLFNKVKITDSLICIRFIKSLNKNLKMEWIRQKCWGTKAKKCMLKKLLPYLILSKSWYLY